MTTPTTPPLTDRQRRILAAIEQGHTELRAICTAANVSSTSAVKSNLERLAAGGHLVLRNTRRGSYLHGPRLRRWLGRRRPPRWQPRRLEKR